MYVPQGQCTVLSCVKLEPPVTKINSLHKLRIFSLSCSKPRSNANTILSCTYLALVTKWLETKEVSTTTTYLSHLRHRTQSQTWSQLPHTVQLCCSEHCRLQILHSPPMVVKKYLPTYCKKGDLPFIPHTLLTALLNVKGHSSTHGPTRITPTPTQPTHAGILARTSNNLKLVREAGICMVT